MLATGLELILTVSTPTWHQTCTIAKVRTRARTHLHLAISRSVSLLRRWRGPAEATKGAQRSSEEDLGVPRPRLIVGLGSSSSGGRSYHGLCAIVQSMGCWTMTIVLRRLRMLILPPIVLATIFLLYGSSFVADLTASDDCFFPQLLSKPAIWARPLYLRVQRAEREVFGENLTQSLDERQIAKEDAQRMMLFLRRVLPEAEASFIQAQASTRLNSTSILTGDSPKCDGKRVFVYDLPSKFNTDLVKQCDTLLPWMSMCTYLSNSGLGPQVREDDSLLLPAGSWFKTHQYALELVFHARLLDYTCRTGDRANADVFYVPYYAGLDVMRWNFVPGASNEQRDSLGKDLIDWLGQQEPWTSSGGRDHFLVLGKITWDFRRMKESDSWGSDLLARPEMQSMTKLLIERHPWHHNDIGVPHPTFFHPRSDDDIRAWQGKVRSSTRRYLVSFAGQPRPGQAESIRGELIRQCSSNSTLCKLLDCGQGRCYGPGSTISLFLSSHFCLQPPGDSPTRRSVFDSLLAGCIPVFFDPYTAYLQYPWHLPKDPGLYSVFIPGELLRGNSSSSPVSVVDVLRAVPTSKRLLMRSYIVDNVLPSIVYAQPGSKLVHFDDAFDISLRNVIRRIASKAEYQQQL